ncbi:MAG: hypothetical protein AAF485_31235 [Chloroflexota bacterium]
MTVEVIALDFFDGATEGFVRSLGDSGPCYFKLIAWDDTQDKRLFAAVAVTQDEYDELVSILASSEPIPTSDVWVPRWEFENNTAKNNADDFIDSIEDRLRSSGLLILGLGVTDSTAKIREYDKVLGQQVGEHIGDNKPDNLCNWSKYFE